MKRNPATPGYIDEAFGSYSKVYFYPNNTVEIIIEENGVGTVDWSKDILITAREITTPAARAHLPEIKRVRIDTHNRRRHFVYQMPIYAECHDRHAVEIASDQSYFGDRRTPISSAFVDIVNVAAYLKIPINFDLYLDNVSLDCKGTLILRDPIAAIASADLLEKRWLEL